MMFSQLIKEVPSTPSCLPQHVYAKMLTTLLFVYDQKMKILFNNMSSRVEFN